MASNLFIYLLLSTCFAAQVISTSRPGHFPLKDCVEDDIDTLALLDYDLDQTWLQQHYLIEYLYLKIKSLSLKWIAASVVDQFMADNEAINVSGWSFQEAFIKRQPYMIRETETVDVPNTDFISRLRLKIEFVERLFDEMSGVRENAIHVGVVFLDGTSLTLEEIGNVPSIVQQHSAGVKIFVVIFGSKLVEEIVHLTDTIVLPNMELSNFELYLLMAMCKQCGENWVPLEHKTGLNMLSCFGMFSNPFEQQFTWISAMSICNSAYNAYLPGIETRKEISFVKKLISGNMKKYNKSEAQFPIGIRRDLSNYAKRFQWVTNPGSYRPVLNHNWLPGQPCRACMDTDCVAWRFTSLWENDDDSNNLFQNKTSFNTTLREGWANINCNSEKTTALLCEVVLPRTSNDVYFNSSIQFPKKNINVTEETEHFLMYDNNNMSVSANVPNPNFLKFLRMKNLDFPIFDCGEDAGDRRFISYNRVCDFVDNCSNRRDELMCGNPLEVKNDGTHCTSGQMLYSKEYKCDNVKDCRDGSDEENCMDNECKSVRCLDGSCLPLQWVNDGEFDCFVYTTRFTEYIVSDESSHTKMHLLTNKSCALSCNRDICIEESQLNDTETVCKGPEGRLVKSIGNLQPANTCNNSFGHFIWAPKCHYIKDRYGGIVGCRDMSHLRDCENFQCAHGYVKCYSSYCISDHYLRDGEADCPTGEDEQLFYTGPCTGHFACWDSNICLHPDLVCDGHPDCPYDDDELGCHDYCPDGFRCIAGTVSVSDYNRSVPLDMDNLSNIDARTRYLDLSGVELSFPSYKSEFEFFLLFEDTDIGIFNKLKVLIMSKCKVSELHIPKLSIENKKQPPFRIQKLDISFNMFEIFSKLEYNYYYKHIDYLNMSYNKQLKLVRNLRFSFLEILDLSYTSLLYLNESVFANLPKLKHLNLSHSLISDFTRQYFSTNPTLQTLDLRGIRTEGLDDYLFHGLTISQTLFTDHVQICCPQIQGLVITSRACIAPAEVDAISSCFNLLGLDIQRFLLWIVAILAVLGNVTVIVYRVMWDRSVLQTGYGLFVTNLGISDFIMGVYLFIIAGADYFYRDNYVLYDKNWRNSVVCKIAGFMACLSCEASTFFVFLITLDRFLVIKFPFGQIKFTGSLKITAVVMAWVASFLLSLVPIVFNFDISSSNAMCLGLPLTNIKAKGWGYSVAVFIIYDLIMFFFVACGQYVIFRAMTENRMSNTSTNMASTRRAKEITVAKQLSLVVLSNFLFWFPVGIMGLMSLGGHEVSSEVYAWTTVLLLPINSAANPVLYTIPALMERWEKFKHGDHRNLHA